MTMMTDACKLALLGQACGDAFGAAFEYNPKAHELAQKSAREQRYLDSVVDCGGRLDWARMPGLYTDDTQQALALLNTRLVCEDEAAQAASYFRQVLLLMARAPVPDAEVGSHRGTGRFFREFLRTSKPVDTAGVGAMMRVGPVATTFEDPAEMIRWVIEVSAVTTSHPVALASTARFATFVWALAHPENRSALKGIDWPTDRVPGDVWKATTRALRIMKDKGEPSLLEYVRSTGWLNKELTCAAGGFSLSGFAWVVDRAFRAVSFEHALIEICASGGDTDTVGAMVGCLAALRFGESGIPLWMVRGLLNYGEIQAPEVWTPSSEDVLTRWENEYRAQKMAEATVKNLTEAINKP